MSKSWKVSMELDVLYHFSTEGSSHCRVLNSWEHLQCSPGNAFEKSIRLAFVQHSRTERERNVFCWTVSHPATSPFLFFVLFFWIYFDQRESMVIRRGGDSEFKDKLSKKNKELSEYLDEIRVNLHQFNFRLCCKWFWLFLELFTFKIQGALCLNIDN